MLYTVRLAVWPIALVSEPLDRRFRRGLIKLYNRGFARVVGMRVIRHGTPPKAPFYLVANHLSYMDMLVVAHQTGAVFVSRGDVADWPVIGAISKSLYVLFIDRTDKRDTVRVNRQIEDTLHKGDGIVVFAESRISCGRDVEPFKSALIQPAVANHIPVHYATLSYQTPDHCPPANEIVGWWRPESFGKHLIRLLGYSGVTATVHFGAEPIFEHDRKELARKLHQAVRKNFVPLN